MSAAMECLEGLPYPFGAHVRDGGVNFAVFSDHARSIELCVFDERGETRYSLHGPFAGVFHGFLRGAQCGLIYGYRAHGDYAPESGHRFNEHKLLLDPYARAIVGKHQWGGAHRGDNSVDNATIALKALVAPELAPARRLARLPDAEAVIYEVHVKGFSATNTSIPPALRGTYAGLAHADSIAHLKRLGVTSLSLLPVQYRLDEPSLVDRGMSNYWGYNTLGFFSVEPRLSMTPDDPIAANEEFRRMVEVLHEHGFEVLLDVVYNHTPEGNEQGATLSFRGLDNKSWYRLERNDLARAENLTGCGNTLNVQHPRVTQFVLDSLRYWVNVMGVDGFRFDLAPVLGRTAQHYDRNAAFFVALKQDPVLSTVRLIAEPWDIGSDGYQVGNFPAGWFEWNDKYRDAVRRYWLDGATTRGELARRFTASSELFASAQRRPTASVNFISVHDGFTLMDMVSFSTKHNRANGEGNRDGRGDEPCMNFGVEGESADAAITELRARVRRAMMATLLLSQGTPMICAGDEIGNSQGGNNNPYCLDNETTWLNWDRADTSFCEFVSRVLALRRSEALLRHNQWLGELTDGCTPTVAWRAPNGCTMSHEQWQSRHERAFACVLHGASNSPQPFFIAFNPHAEASEFCLPEGSWRVVLDSSRAFVSASSGDAVSGSVFMMPSRAVVVLRA
ncbi:MAG: glycogen debranching enzyme GlgX [Betaproteobacteria bacterium]|nr:MAG: glycogen debranching enzyme GlgX [Betaproteobacteria bacterium]